MEVAHITGATRNLGAPKDWDASRDGPCGGLPIRDEMHSPGLPRMMSAWMPTAEELAALNAGAPVYLSVIGAVHPPVWVGVGVPPAPVAKIRSNIEVRTSGERWRHIKRGTIYTEVSREARDFNAFEGMTCTSNAVEGKFSVQGVIVRGDTVVYYEGDDGQRWARAEQNFMDGRFEQVSNTR